MKAMILAAGRGERMQALTELTPKPLLTVGNQFLIDYSLYALATAGIKEVVINVCYQAQQIIETLGRGQRYGLKISYADETAGCLGTGGGVYNALKYLGEEPFILLSADIFTSFPLNKLPKKLQGLAHLVLVNNPSFNPEGDFCLAADGQINSDSQPKLTYANIAVIHPKLFQNAPIGAFPMKVLLQQAIVNKQISGELYQGYWDNIGTPQQLVTLNQMLKQRHGSCGQSEAHATPG